MTQETKGARFLFTRTIQEILGSEDIYTPTEPIFEALEDKNMSIKDLALALGRSQSTIRKWLDARGNPSVRDMASVTYVLDRKILVDKEIT